jgi:hypothetical protein
VELFIPLLDFTQAVAANHNGAQSNDNDVDEAMLFGTFNPGVFEVFEMMDDGCIRVGHHGLCSSESEAVSEEHN